MTKVSFILNALFSIVLLGLIGVMLFFGYRYYADEDNVSLLNVEAIENDVNQGSVSVVQTIPNQVNTEPDVVPQSQQDSVLIPAVVATEVATEKRTAPVVPKKQFIKLYPRDDEKYSAFTTLEKDKGIVVYTPGDEWTEIISAKGVPIWIRGDLVKDIGSGYVEVIRDRVNARSEPNTETSVVLGSVVQGELLNVSRKNAGWVRAWSPIRFKAWVKTEDLNRI